jgi:hypothetical protein
MPRCPLWEALAALLRDFDETRPRAGGGKRTPARRALDNPIAITCLAERAPCLPWRICCISSRTNSPACVLGAFPSRLSRRARATVFFSGIVSLVGLLVGWMPCENSDLRPLALRSVGRVHPPDLGFQALLQIVSRHSASLFVKRSGVAQNLGANQAPH